MRNFTFDVGDLVYMKDKEQQSIVFGFVTDRYQNLLYGQHLNEYGVKWFDGMTSTEHEDEIMKV